MTLHPSSRMASRSWVANRTARSPRRSFRSAAAFFMVSGSMPVKGSSSSRVSHPAQRARSRAARRFCPRKASGQAGQAPAHHIQIVENPTRFAFCIVFFPPEAPVPRSALRSAAGRADPPERQHRPGPRPAPCRNPVLPAPSGCGAGWSCPAAGCPENGRLRKGKIQILKERFFSKAFC